MRVGPAGPQAFRLCQSHPRTICNVETPVSLYLWARLSWFWAINPNGASAMWALVLEDQKCPATSLNYVIILPPPSPRLRIGPFQFRLPRKQDKSVLGWEGTSRLISTP